MGRVVDGISAGFNDVLQRRAARMAAGGRRLAFVVPAILLTPKRIWRLVITH
jgi:hypothetical protein